MALPKDKILDISDDVGRKTKLAKKGNLFIVHWFCLMPSTRCSMNDLFRLPKYCINAVYEIKSIYLWEIVVNDWSLLWEIDRLFNVIVPKPIADSIAY